VAKKAGEPRKLVLTYLVEFPGECELNVLINGHDKEPDWYGSVLSIRDGRLWNTPTRGDAGVAELEVRRLVKHLAQAEPAFG
jgi:homospermidine synthase